MNQNTLRFFNHNTEYEIKSTNKCIERRAYNFNFTFFQFVFCNNFSSKRKSTNEWRV